MTNESNSPAATHVLIDGETVIEPTPNPDRAAPNEEGAADVTKHLPFTREWLLGTFMLPDNDVDDIMRAMNAALAADRAARTEATPRVTCNDPMCDQVLSERDENEEWATRLADAIATHLGVDIGEWTAGLGSAESNNPWQAALDAIEGARTEATKAEPVGQERFQHYKGGTYTYVCQAKRESDGALLAIYQSESVDDQYAIYARPHDEFDSKFTSLGDALAAQQPASTESAEPVALTMRDVVWRLERIAGNTDTDPRWIAAQAIRALEGWESFAVYAGAAPAPVRESALKAFAERERGFDRTRINRATREAPADDAVRLPELPRHPYADWSNLVTDTLRSYATAAVLADRQRTTPEAAQPTDAKAVYWQWRVRDAIGSMGKWQDMHPATECRPRPETL